MKIAYSCAGEGLGHASRMVCLGPLLEQRFEVGYFVPDPVRAYVAGRLPNRDLRPLPWFEFTKKGDRVLYWATFFHSLRRSLSMVSEVLSLARDLKEGGFDAVLSDYDPYLAWAARFAGIRNVQFNHPGIVGRRLTFDPRCWAAALVGWLMEGPWNQRFHVSFYLGDIGPQIRPELLARRRSRTGPWLLHLKPEYRGPVLAALERAGITDYELFPRKDGDFDGALARCRGVISSAGHQIISEALVLGKPILVLPQAGQYEQALNAKMLCRARRGMRSTLAELDRTLPRFQAWAQSFVPLGQRWTDDTQGALEKLSRALTGRQTGIMMAQRSPSECKSAAVRPESPMSPSRSTSASSRTSERRLG